MQSQKATSTIMTANTKNKKRGSVAPASTPASASTPATAPVGTPSPRLLTADRGVLFLRLFVATLLFTQAITKSQDYLMIENEYPSIWGITSDQVVTIVGLLELGAGVLLAIGLFTRIAAAVMVVVMFGAAFLFFPGQTFAQAELHVVYAGIYIFLLIVGAGRFSLDSLLRLGER